jgi:hypothetical protein
MEGECRAEGCRVWGLAALRFTALRSVPLRSARPHTRRVALRVRVYLEDPRSRES